MIRRRVPLLLAALTSVAGFAPRAPLPAAARVRMDLRRWNAKRGRDADLHDLAKLFLCDLDERAVEVVNTEAHDGWYKNDVLVLDDGWASVGPEGIMQYPFDHHGWELPEAKREQVHICPT